MPLTLALLVTLVAPAESPTRVDDIPALERTRDHFYGAIAADKRGVTVRWQVSPAAVTFGESCTLRLVVSNAVNPAELVRPPLLDFADFRDLFSAVEDLPTETDPSGEVTFPYRVTPRNDGAFHIPELKYRYFQPLAPEGFGGLATHAVKVPFSVTKPTAPPASPLVAPADYFAVRTDGAFTRGGGPGGWAWAGLFAAGVAVGVVWVVGWRRLFPDGARLAAIRRHRAVRIALDRLRRPRVPPEAIAVTLRNYLIARYGLSFTAQTPAEVASGLEKVGVPAERAAEAEGVLRACDAVRFAAADTGVSAAQVAGMIERWES
jgi:hypothetical protein